MSGGMPHTPSGGGNIAPPISACPSARMSMKALRSNASAMARRRSGSPKGGGRRLMIRVGAKFVGRTSQIVCGTWLLTSLRSGTVSERLREGHIELAGDKRENRRRPVRYNHVFDPAEVRPAFLPIIRVPAHLDGLVRLELDELEWAGADRVLSHLARWDVTGIDRRVSRSEEPEQRELWPPQAERRG